MDELDETRKASIRAALESYRRQVEERNIAMMKAGAQKILDSPVPSMVSESKAAEHRLFEFVSRAMAHGIVSIRDVGDMPPSLEELLDESMRPEIVSRWGLDGIWDNPVDVEKKMTWFSEVRQTIEGLELQAESKPQDVPAELVYLSTLVDQIHGPGLPFWRFTNQVHFISSLSDPSDANLAMAAFVQVPPSPPAEPQIDDPAFMLYYVWEAWKKAVAIQIGAAEEFSDGGSYAIYCRKLRTEEMERPVDDGDEGFAGQQWKEEDNEWKWRYGTRDGDWHSKLYDSVEEFLEWYAHCKDPTTEDCYL